MSQLTQAVWNPQTKTFASVDLRGLDLMNSSQFQEITKNAVFVLKYDVKRPEGMSDADFQEYVSTLRTQAQTLRTDGWTKKAIKDGYIDTVNAAYDPNKEMSIAAQLGQYLNDARTFGSELFQKMWGIDYQTAKETNDSRAAEKLLGIAMKYTGMPGELDGSAEQTQAILDKMSDSLAPDDDFWDDFAKTVQVAYPDDSGDNALGDKGGNETLKQQVHQFRYVISTQQAQWVRDNYKKDGMTDEEALAAYLSTMEEGNGDNQYSLSESSRAHNKIRVDDDGNIIYPGGSNANYKVTIGFHSEFIVDQNGNFLNEVDPEGRTDNGTINGASFNYAEKNDDLHEKLDGNNAIERYDPEYRKTESEHYYAPNDLKSTINEGWEDFKSAVTKGEGDRKSWNDSYWNSKGVYSVAGESSHDRVNKEADEFRGMIESY